eukprot:1143971-Pelagomonas_calceolata.AAC.1
MELVQGCKSGIIVSRDDSSLHESMKRLEMHGVNNILHASLRKDGRSMPNPGDELMRVWEPPEVNRMGMSGRRLRPIGTARSLPQRVPDHRKVALLTGPWKAVFEWFCLAALEMGVTCLTV